jgi:uncharacterized membrane protein YfcA
MPEIQWILSYISLGAVVGFFAGLLGIGGGGIIVPILTTLFLVQNFPLEHIVHLALASSMATIIFTSISSIRSHHQHKAIIWPIVFNITPGIALGTFIAAYFTAYLSTQLLAILFSALMALIALQMFFNKKPNPQRNIPNMLGLNVVGTMIGVISALAAIGGGSLSVPFMTWCNVSIKKAIATSSAIGFPIAVSGTLGYIFGGIHANNLPAQSIGYIYLPAVIGIAAVSVLTAPLGVKTAHRLPVPMLKKLFGLLLLGLSIKMLFSIL